MNSFRCIPFITIFLVFVLFQACKTEAEGGEDEGERNCSSNNLSPDNESENGTFNDFATKLEYYTGLSQQNYSVELTCEDETKTCIIDPYGTAIWDARTHLYMNNMMSNTNDSRITLDGCLCFSNNIEEFASCMDEVRQNMIEQLDSVLIVKFKEIVENNCTMLQENCS